MNGQTNVRLTPDVVDTISRWQEGGAELWMGMLMRCVECIANDVMGDAENRLTLVGELLNLKNELAAFVTPQEGGEQ